MQTNATVIQTPTPIGPIPQNRNVRVTEGDVTMAVTLAILLILITAYFMSKEERHVR